MTTDEEVVAQIRHIDVRVQHAHGSSVSFLRLPCDRYVSSFEVVVAVQEGHVGWPDAYEWLGVFREVPIGEILRYSVLISFEPVAIYGFDGNIHEFGNGVDDFSCACDVLIGGNCLL